MRCGKSSVMNLFDFLSCPCSVTNFRCFELSFFMCAIFAVDVDLHLFCLGQDIRACINVMEGLFICMPVRVASASCQFKLHFLILGLVLC